MANTMRTLDPEQTAKLPYPKLLDDCSQRDVRSVLLHLLDLINYDARFMQFTGQQDTAGNQRISKILDNVQHIAINHCDTLDSVAKINELYQARQRVFDNYANIASTDTDILPVVIGMLVLGKWRCAVNAKLLTTWPAFIKKYSMPLSEVALLITQPLARQHMHKSTLTLHPH